MTSTGAFITGCAGLALSPEEESFIREFRPWGLILFRRNVESVPQVRALSDGFRALVGRRNAPVLVDQEGGRVQRLGPPSNYWRKYPAASRYGELFARDSTAAVRAARLIARLMAEDLRETGINVDCLPVLDVPQPGSHDVIGDRAYGATPEIVSILARAAMMGLIAGGVLPVIKHIPGHGRAIADSHHGLPSVAASKAELEKVDFPPFAALADAPMAMTAHVVYEAIDKAAPATLSRKVMRLIRRSIGFSGLIMTDDLSMKALSGSLSDRARGALEAGCDMVLHCNGKMAEMVEVATAAGELRGKSKSRARAALAMLRKPAKFDRKAALADLAELSLAPA